ncbi:hypothetical protein A0H81_05879 [Grifola frondosa]|uniref:Uncharacterized protein n=1 Tax=Grifola frondosa TaxID=5627 RepID=A0A1C7MA90_GRIFR|nr:hypothetical protein A0H81_05879 [Grifola frondosa]
MAKILAGYTLEQDELAAFIKAAGYGPGPGEPDPAPFETWMDFMEWRANQPPVVQDPNTIVPYPHWFNDMEGKHVHAFITRTSKPHVTNMNLRFKESDIDRLIRDRFIKMSNNIFQASNMRFFSLPSNYVGVEVD